MQKMKIGPWEAVVHAFLHFEVMFWRPTFILNGILAGILASNVRALLPPVRATCVSDLLLSFVFRASPWGQHVCQ